MKQLMEKDTTFLSKTNFQFKNDSIEQDLKITWYGDTAMIAKIDYIKHGEGETSGGSYLHEKDAEMDFETYDDSLDNSHPVLEYVLDAKESGYNSLKVALDTSFAVLTSWGPDSKPLQVLLNKIMYRKK